MSRGFRGEVEARMILISGKERSYASDFMLRVVVAEFSHRAVQIPIALSVVAICVKVDIKKLIYTFSLFVSRGYRRSCDSA